MHMHLPVISNQTAIAVEKFIHNQLCTVITLVCESKAAHR